MATFKKAVLKVGTYQSPDGPVEVTRERLNHWADTFRKMSDADAKIPIGWDHAEELDRLIPLSSEQFNKQSSAKNTIGRLADFRVTGDQAELQVEVSDPIAEGRAERNEVYVSPVIFPRWKDSHGNEFTDCITHVDFVNHPVDHSQGPFARVEPGFVACGLRMGLSTKIYRMAEDSKMADDDKKPEAKDDDKGGDAAGEGDGSSSIGDVLKALANMNIVLPGDTTPDNLLDRLHSALLTANAHQGNGDDDDKGGDDKPGDSKVSDPGMAMMSQQVRASLHYAEQAHRTSVGARLQRLLADGKCTPAEAREQEKQLPAVKLSLDASGNPKKSQLEHWLESREALQRGACWDASTRTRMSQVVEPPARMGSLSSELTPEEAKATADWALGRPAAKS